MRLSSLLLAPLTALTLSSAASAAIDVHIDKPTQTMTVSRDGELLYRWPVSTGRRGYDTPSGTFRAFRMEKDHFSKEWDDAPMPNSIFFTKKGHALHGYLDTKNIGRPASHGCVRLRPENAATLYALVEKDGVLNTTVTITGETPPFSSPALVRNTPRNPASEQEYQPQDANYPRRYGDQETQQPPARYGQPRYSYDDGAPRYARPYDPRYNGYQRRYDPRYDDDEDAPPPPPRRGFFQPFFPFGSD
ncbi:MAG TPA: L,D-transpeptidase [Pseudorhodoplanes sp.]|jgi:hypothetical protein|nr:L,D-transpeptidase [Pseudorhodoplanes sp.]